MSRSILFHSRIVRPATPWNIRRGYVTAFDVNSIETVPLQFEKVPRNVESNLPPIVFLHGFLGSRRNWMSISKNFARSSGRPVYVIDLRNHGYSPHKRPHTYEAMAADLFHFFQTYELKNVTLIGHSMGGKAAMSMALHPKLPKDTISELIVEDIAPSRGPLSPEFRSYVEAMQSIEESRVKTRQKAIEILSKTEKDMNVVNFLLMNLIIPKSGLAQFRVPLEILHDHLDDLGSFPYNPGDVEWNGPTLLIKGSKSNFVNKNNFPIAQQFFPNMKSLTLDASHWVHAERPLEFRDAIFDFLKLGK